MALSRNLLRAAFFLKFKVDQFNGTCSYLNDFNLGFYANCQAYLIG
jgi:hypothetical protein